MSRWHQTWTCRVCGHSATTTVSYPKYGGSERPLTLLEARSRCSHCGLRGTAKITEEAVTTLRVKREG